MANYNLELPLTSSDVAKLKIGDQVSLSGTIVTGRDAAHKFMVEESPEFLHELLRGTFIYHCGPIVKQVPVTDQAPVGFEIVAAGPTTSIREEPYQAKVVEHYKLAGAIGKGGMGAKTLAGLSGRGVYLHAPGGCATVLANSITRVLDVHKLEEFGSPEAFWVLEVKDFPAVVTMDSHEKSLHSLVMDSSTDKLNQLLQDVL